MVGDIALLEPGEVVLCDGIFLFWHNVKCDESAATSKADTHHTQEFEDMIHKNSVGPGPFPTYILHQQRSRHHHPLPTPSQPHRI